MAAAVAAAVGDHIPAPVSSSCLDILPKTGQLGSQTSPFAVK